MAQFLAKVRDSLIGVKNIYVSVFKLSVITRSSAGNTMAASTPRFRTHAYRIMTVVNLALLFMALALAN